MLSKDTEEAKAEDDSSKDESTETLLVPIPKVTNYAWNGEFPAPYHLLAKRIHATHPASQETYSEHVSFLMNTPNEDLSIINTDEAPSTICFLLPTPERKFRTLVGLGTAYDLRGIQTTTVGTKLTYISIFTYKQ